MREYLIVVERAPSNYCAYCPDVPGCVATGATIAEVSQRMQEALEWHLEALKEKGEEIPLNNSIPAFVSVAMSENPVEAA